MNLDAAINKYGEHGVLRAIRNMYQTINDWEPGKKLPVIPAKPKTATNEPSISHDAPPCVSCGGTVFLRTGTCHVCQTCGTSQGCS